jgi:hypothetical protein
LEAVLINAFAIFFVIVVVMIVVRVVLLRVVNPHKNIVVAAVWQ